MASGWEADLRKQVEDKVAEKTIELAKKAADKMTEEYSHMLDWFYGEYDPRFYHRTGGLQKSGKRFYKNSHGGLGVVWGGVEFGSEFMSDNYKNPYTGEKRSIDNPGRVFESFLNGFHGPEFMGIAFDSVPGGYPYQHMIEYRDYLMNHLV